MLEFGASSRYIWPHNQGGVSLSPAIRMPTIAIDARKYFDFGIGIYIQNLIASYSSLNTPYRFALYVSAAERAKVTAPKDWELRDAPYGKYSPGEFLFFGRQALREGVDLFHAPHYTLPSGLQGRSVVTIHDLIHLKLPQYFSSAQRAYARFMVAQAVRNAGAIIASSRNTKGDLIELFGIAEERVTVVHLGISESFRPIEAAQIEQFRQKHELAAPYLLYVGNVKPHKNVATLLRAFSRIRPRYPDLRLAFVGGRCLQDQDLASLARRLGITDFIRDLGRIDEQEVLGAYNAAEMLILPSLYEGFGFTVLEAMACGTPTVVSDGGSLPEVAGDASLACDPGDPDSFVGAIETLLTDTVRRAQLISLGRERIKRFTWQETARQTLKVYEKVIDKCNVG